MHRKFSCWIFIQPAAGVSQSYIFLHLWFCGFLPGCLVAFYSTVDSYRGRGRLNAHLLWISALGWQQYNVSPKATSPEPDSTDAGEEDWKEWVGTLRQDGIWWWMRNGRHHILKRKQSVEDRDRWNHKGLWDVKLRKEWEERKCRRSRWAYEFTQVISHMCTENNPLQHKWDPHP